MDENKVTALLQNEDFAKKVAVMETPEAVQAAFKAEGADISLDEVKAIGRALAAKVSGAELSDDDLENVAGGFVVTTAMVTSVVAANALLVSGVAAGSYLSKHSIKEVFSRW